MQSLPLLQRHQICVSYQICGEARGFYINWFSAIFSSDYRFGEMVKTTLSYFHYYEIVDGISSFIKTQPILNVFITAVLALFFSPVLLFICFMGIAALSVIIPFSLFYQTCVLMVKIPTNFLKRLMSASTKSP